MASSTIDDSTQYRSNIPGVIQSIPTIASSDQTTDHIASSFANGTYTYNGLYTFNINTRLDGANFFGASTNQKLSPLWSIGGAWYISRENFFPTDWMPLLTLRASTGKLGNISRLASAYTIMSGPTSSITGTPYPASYIVSPPNTDLRWESVSIANLALDFATRGHILKGTIEYYTKTSSGLMAQVFDDPTLGGTQNPGTRSFYYRNDAIMKGRGLDAELTSHNLQGRLQWVTTLLFSKSSSVVTKFSYPAGEGRAYLSSNLPNPVPGRPLNAVYAFKWGGLDPRTGDPIGYYNGQSSTDWAAIYNHTAWDSMVYKGPAQPTIYGALRNTFLLDHFSLSFNVSYKFGYSYRLPGLSYTDLLTKWNSTSDYTFRWQKPGDEMHTSIPSFNPSASVARDLFYGYSEARVGRADNIRLEDIILGFEKDNFVWGKFHCRRLRLFTNFSNLPLLWKASSNGPDPYYVNVPKDGMRVTMGFTVFF
jgi:hypothetical protein